MKRGIVGTFHPCRQGASGQGRHVRLRGGSSAERGPAGEEEGGEEVDCGLRQQDKMQGHMRTLTISLVVVVLLAIGVTYGQTGGGAGLQGGILFAPNSARTVTATRSGVLLASLQIPQGTLLIASYDEQNPTSFTAGRWEFHGDFALYAAPAGDNTFPRAPLRNIDQVRSAAPLVLSMRDVDVLISNVDPSN